MMMIFEFENRILTSVFLSLAPSGIPHPSASYNNFGGLLETLVAGDDKFSRRLDHDGHQSHATSCF